MGFPPGGEYIDPSDDPVWLRKRIKELNLRVQLYQFAFDKVDELNTSLKEYPNLKDMWIEFEIAYKLSTGKNLMKFEEILRHSVKSK
jgi:hypothetical protein